MIPYKEIKNKETYISQKQNFSSEKFFGPRPHRSAYVFRNICFFVFLLLTVFSITKTQITYADTASDAAALQAQIDSRNSSIAALEKEIAQYQAQLDSTSKQATSLSNTIAQLDLSKKKLEASLAVTKDKIAAKNLQISQLTRDIGRKETNITTDQQIIGTALAQIERADSTSLIEIILSKQSLSDILSAIDDLGTIQKNIQEKISDLRTAKTVLESNVTQTKIKKAELVSLNTNLTNQRAVLLATEKEKTTLLAQTKNSEAAYKKIIADKAAQQAAFGQELLKFEQALKLTVNAAALPSTGASVLAWPLDKIKITQYFGNTDFATKNPQIYNGKGHTGMDFAASIGTPVKAALSGIISGVGNTDLIPGCYSYGKWVMIKHPDGLSTLYAHLSLPTVTKGQTVSTGEIIGYSGSTGYATGPHLHFGVYATDGVVITDYVNSAHCKGAVIPLADIKAYLNPLSYLPH